MALTPAEMKVDYAAKINEEKAKGANADQSKINEYTEKRAEKIAASDDSQLQKWGVDRAGQSLSDDDAKLPSGPATLTPTEMQTLMHSDVANDISIKMSDGSTVNVTGYVLNGHSYEYDKETGEGVRLFNYGTDTDGKYQGDGRTTDYGYKPHVDDDTGINCQSYGNVSFAQNPKPSVPTPSIPSSPPRPAFVSFNQPQPTFSSDLKNIQKFSYFFGLDSLKLVKVNINRNCCFVSREMQVGELSDGEYIQLEAVYDINEESSVEFYIVDGSKEVPIVPVGDQLISNEKIFFGLMPRFSVDTTQPVIIKKDGKVVDLTLDAAVHSNDALYTVTYTPINAYSYKPFNDTVKVKVIQRLYGTGYDAPSVSKMKIRKYGGDVLWKQDTSAI